MILEEEDGMKKAISHLNSELSKLEQEEQTLPC